ncbi:chemotaxis protein CheA [bacterium AH-315-J21]|nr:chemotaxis protein CheA [bacterium AH-315-J21]
MSPKAEEEVMAPEALQVPDDMKEFVDDFLVEAGDIIESLDNDLVALESSPDDLELLDNIFRAAHTIKGNSSFLGLDQITDLTHKMEDVLNRLRKGEIHVEKDVMDALLEGLDNLKLLLADVRNEKIVKRDVSGLIVELERINNSPGDSGKSPASDKAGASSAAKAESDSNEDEGEFDEAAFDAEIKAALAQSLAQESDSKPKESSAAVSSPAKNDRKSGGRKIEQTVRVGVDRLDSLMNLVGELVLGRNSLLSVNAEIANGTTSEHDSLEKITSVASQISFVTTELQNSVMKLRMLPIGKVFSRFPRVVRDLAANAGKKINLTLQGEDTELDKTVIEEIGDPLVHLVRNSCDHGLEPPEERIAAGKPEVGTVLLSAYSQGSNIIIEITDDGRGLDLEAIKSKAIERGLTTAADIERMSEGEIFRFIFGAGFSTAKVVSDVSGRGVGMDVVRSNIEKLNGIIEIASTRGKGTTITIKLPLTLSIIQGLLVRANKDIYIIPLASVHEIVNVGFDDVKYVNGTEVIQLRDSVLPLLFLPRVLRDGKGWKPSKEASANVVVIGLAESRLGLVVDDLIGQEEVVIKSLGKLFGNIEGLAGATILGDGRVRLIVDVAGLFGLAQKIAN